jgi:hypothetical protein
MVQKKNRRGVLEHSDDVGYKDDDDTDWTDNLNQNHHSITQGRFFFEVHLI